MAEWSFGRVQGAVIAGFKNSGIDLFQGNPLDRMVRECIQNSLDAKDDAVEGPVLVAMTLDSINPAEGEILSGLDPFLSLGLAQSTANGGKEKTWYKESKKTVAQQSVQILGIHDANTIGLRGTSNKLANQKSRWLALVAGQGVNLGQGADGLGGFGHGSNAAFAMSRLRTAFYLSSSEEEDEKVITRFQGHSLLQTLIVSEEYLTAPDGFFGNLGANNESSPLTASEIPTEFTSRRLSAVGGGLGTSVFVCDPFIYDEERSWNEILVSVVANFALAIHFGKLKVTLGDGTVIERETLADAYSRVQAMLNDEPLRQSLEIAKETWRNLTSVETLLFPDEFSQQSIPITNFGQIYWFLRVGGNVTGKGVAVAREPGMIITYKAPSLGIPALGKYKDFDLLVCVRTGSPGQSGAEIIKQMEDPTHTELNIKRVSEENKAIVNSKYKSFAAAVKKQILDEYAQSEHGEVESIDIDGLFVPAFSGDEDQKDSMSDVSISKGKIVRKPPKWPTPEPGTDGPGQGEPPVGGGTDGGVPGGGGSEPPPKPDGSFVIDNVKYQKAQLGYLQIVPTGLAEADFVQLKVVGHQLLKGKSRLSLFIAGETQTQKVELREEATKALETSAHGTVEFGNGSGGRQEVLLWIPQSKLNLAFGGELFRGISS